MDCPFAAEVGLLFPAEMNMGFFRMPQAGQRPQASHEVGIADEITPPGRLRRPVLFCGSIGLFSRHGTPGQLKNVCVPAGKDVTRAARASPDLPWIREARHGTRVAS